MKFQAEWDWENATQADIDWLRERAAELIQRASDATGILAKDKKSDVCRHHDIDEFDVESLLRDQAEFNFEDEKYLGCSDWETEYINNKIPWSEICRLSEQLD